MTRCTFLLLTLFAAASAGAAPAPPAHQRVAFVLSDGAVMIDFAGPWEVFQDVMLPSRGPSMDDQHPFQLYTVADTTSPVRASDGMRILPDYTFDTAPKPDIVVVPAQSGRSPKMMAWLRQMATGSGVVMSVCNGAFVLADAGLLDGKHATAHHGALNLFQARYPKVTVERGMRYVQSDRVIYTAGGLSSGIDLALHIVERYFGRDAAQATATMMEYEGAGWKGDGHAATAFVSAPPPSYPSDASARGPVGRWSGAIKTHEDGDFDVVLHLWREKDGKVGGAVDSIDDDAYGIPVSDVSIRGSKISFEVPSVMGAFDGTLEASTIRGTWKQHDTTAPLDLTRAPRGR